MNNPPLPAADKYCSLVASEGGLNILHRVVQQPGVGEHIANLANTVIAHCTIYAVRGGGCRGGAVFRW